MEFGIDCKNKPYYIQTKEENDFYREWDAYVNTIELLLRIKAIYNYMSKCQLLYL